jgi:hypothetical protein
MENWNPPPPSRGARGGWTVPRHAIRRPRHSSAGSRLRMPAAATMQRPPSWAAAGCEAPPAAWRHPRRRARPCARGRAPSAAATPHRPPPLARTPASSARTAPRLQNVNVANRTISVWHGATENGPHTCRCRSQAATDVVRISNAAASSSSSVRSMHSVAACALELGGLGVGWIGWRTGCEGSSGSGCGRNARGEAAVAVCALEGGLGVGGRV